MATQSYDAFLARPGSERYDPRCWACGSALVVTDRFVSNPDAATADETPTAYHVAVECSQCGRGVEALSMASVDDPLALRAARLGAIETYHHNEADGWRTYDRFIAR